MLIYAAGRDQGDVREWRMQGTNVRGTANGSTGKDLDEIGLYFPGGHNLGGRQGSGKDDHITANGKMDEIEIEAGAGEN